MTTSSGALAGLCPTCHIGQMRETFATYTQWYEGQLIVAPNVPAQVCDYCDEIRYHPLVLERLNQLLWAEVKPPESSKSAQRTANRPSA
jgi:YgiT-type zinc finger domain-containing protein